MKCPKCNKRYLRINGTFDGVEDIKFKANGEFTVEDSAPGDFSWEDHDTVVCLNCNHIGTVLEFRGEDED